MREIPEIVDRIGVPELLSVSQLPYAEDCPLRAVLGSAFGEAPALVAHPAAAIGNLFHRLVEAAARGEITAAATTDARAQVERHLTTLVDESRERLSNDPATRFFADLPNTLSRLAWRRKARAAVDAAVALLPQHEMSFRKRQTGQRRRCGELSVLPREGTWAEVGVRCPTLRMRGRIDLLSHRGDVTTVKDLKTGRVQDRFGEMLPHIALQLRLYGLATFTAMPGRSIRLVVDDGTESEVPFDEGERAETAAWLQRVLETMPVGESTAATLAQVGPACSRCPFRHACGAYIADAPRLWTDGAEWRLPLDTWGTIEELRYRGELVDLTIRDAAQRKVRVFGVRGVRLSALQRGENLWFFGLGGGPRRGSDARWRQPRNFHEMANDGTRRHAWTLEVFGEVDRTES